MAAGVRPVLLCGPSGWRHRLTHHHREYYGYSGEVVACRSFGRGEKWRVWVKPFDDKGWRRVDVTPAGLRRLRYAVHLGTSPRSLADAVSALSRAEARVGTRTALDVPLPTSRFCDRHFSWLCQAGQGECQRGDGRDQRVRDVTYRFGDLS